MRPNSIANVFNSKTLLWRVLGVVIPKKCLDAELYCNYLSLNMPCCLNWSCFFILTYRYRTFLFFPFFSLLFVYSLVVPGSQTIKISKSSLHKQSQESVPGHLFQSIVKILSEFPPQMLFCKKTETFHNHFERLKNKQRPSSFACFQFTERSSHHELRDL